MTDTINNGLSPDSYEHVSPIIGAIQDTSDRLKSFWWNVGSGNRPKPRLERRLAPLREGIAMMILDHRMPDEVFTELSRLNGAYNTELDAFSAHSYDYYELGVRTSANQLHMVIGAEATKPFVLVGEPVIVS